MTNDVYIKDTKIYNYNNDEFFNPSELYPEGINLNIKSDKRIYDEIRNLLIEMKLDEKNVESKKWNPFSDFIKKGDSVVIKPNLVQHINKLKSDNTDCLITNFSIIRPIIDYTIIALKNTGKIIVGDAPVQECIFSEVIKLNGLEEAIEIYNKSGYKIDLVDFRKNNNPSLKCKIVSLGSDSSLVPIDEYSKKYAITNYDLRQMHQHHHDGLHEYLLPNDILNADVIINLPKPKTHRKAGMTACMKNFFGVNGKKEYLPHHRNGSVHSHGDEYPEKSLIKFFKSNVKNYTYTHNPFIIIFNRILKLIQKVFKKNRYTEGSWYGNDTLWRTILDINKVVLYADKNGKMTNKKQRTIFNLADMIISGEKEGPLDPTSKKVGLIVASFNQLNSDKVICQIMGFNPDKIKYIKNGYKLEKYAISSDSKFNTVINNNINVDINNYNKHFIPSDGWIDYLSK